MRSTEQVCRSLPAETMSAVEKDLRRVLCLVLAVFAGVLLAPTGAQADFTGPSVTITSGPAEGSFTNDSTPTFEFSSDDLLATYQCWMDSDTPVNPVDCSSKSFTPSSLSDGQHSFHVQASDTLANPGAPAVRTFTVDTVGPTVSIDS